MDMINIVSYESRSLNFAFYIYTHILQYTLSIYYVEYRIYGMFVGLGTCPRTIFLFRAIMNDREHFIFYYIFSSKERYVHQKRWWDF